MQAEIQFQNKQYSENFWYGLLIDFTFVIPPAVLGAFFPFVDSEKHPYWAVTFYIFVFLYLAGFFGLAFAKNHMQRTTNQSNINQVNEHLLGVSDLLTDFRCALISFRSLANRVTYTATNEKLKQLVQILSTTSTFPFLAEEILREIFWIVSKGNRDLNVHITIGLLVPEGDRLRVAAYVNSDMSPSSNAKGFTKDQGCAGKCWSSKVIVIVPNLEKDDIGGFVASSSRHHQIRSIACFPVIFTDKESREEEFIGVLSMDSDKADYFKEVYRESLRTKLEPFMSMLRCIYRLKNIAARPQNSQPVAG